MCTINQMHFDSLGGLSIDLLCERYSCRVLQRQGNKWCWACGWFIREGEGYEIFSSGSNLHAPTVPLSPVAMDTLGAIGPKSRAFLWEL